MTSQYLCSLRGDYLTEFEKCMHHKGKFEYHEVGVKPSTLKYLEWRKLVEVVGKRPNVYIVPKNIAEGFMKRFPDFVK